ncbi:CocE/NonD family hydrolase [Nucisporomicrobium flavum]|uniref:CocE/NonD family hydrolase n=1 Tax=Nucisporomicrobium flavum TaxID=2785915 RepID=UPI0018F784B5|nr:CocE/NonD family hydrolase [Nucisporomicrobium flavum]
MNSPLGRLLRLPPPRTRYTVETGVRIPMRDGVELRATHYAPRDRARGTVLIRTPYGRGLPASLLQGRMLAARGYHVLVGSVRGTFGSGGTFVPMAQETADGQDTVAWLRTRDWFDGRLATLGASYLGWAQWTLLLDPPPELTMAVIAVGPHDFRDAVFGTGAFTLGDFLSWSHQIAGQEQRGVNRVRHLATARRRVRPGLHGLPLADAAEPVLQGRAPWYREWLSHPEGSDPFWDAYRAGPALDRVTVPVLLISGWQDLFLDQTLTQYETLQPRGADVSLLVGPWTHLGVATKGTTRTEPVTLAWLDHYVAGDATPAPAGTVSAYRTGEEKWHDLPLWPPTTGQRAFTLTPDGTLSSAKTAPPGAVIFRYDPRNPTPSVGGRVLSGSMGVRDNRKLEARGDVVTFTSPALTADLDLAGNPTLELDISVGNPYADVFARLCDVDPSGHSRNFSDALLRLDPSVPAGAVQKLTLRLDSCFHRVRAGHRLRLQLSGGAHPRFARNLGTDGKPVDGAELAPSVHTIHCGTSRLIAPITS